MSAAAEQPVVFACGEAELIGILHQTPGMASDIGVVIVVGGPQYRAGSQRQFVQTARFLAQNGYPVLRFDIRGMGDSGGAYPGFESEDDDIRSAIDTLLDRHPGVGRVILWGLCDAASAILLYAPADHRVAGAILVNPWVRQEETHARSQIRHYYGGRWTSGVFWRRLLSGEVDIAKALSGWIKTLRRAAAPRDDEPEDFTVRMERGLQDFSGQVLLLTSGNDLTAQEFIDLTSENPGWTGLLGKSNISCQHLALADHTFSSRAHREEADRRTIDWLRANF